MNYRAVSILLFMSQAVWADRDLVPAEIDKTPPPALTIDNWKPTVEKPPKTEEPAAAVPETAVAVPEQVAVPKPASVAEPPAPAVQKQEPVVRLPQAGMNEMKGVLTSIDTSGKTIRLSVEGGYLPEFGYDAQTVVASKGRLLKLTDLNHGDRVIIRYKGKEMTAREIEKLTSGA